MKIGTPKYQPIHIMHIEVYLTICSFVELFRLFIDIFKHNIYIKSSKVRFYCIDQKGGKGSVVHVGMNEM